MTRIFGFAVVGTNEEAVIKKVFDATKDTEKTLASALYAGLKKKPEGHYAITLSYGTMYTFYHLEKGKFYVDEFDGKQDDLIGIDAKQIEQYINAFKAGTDKPIAIKDAYAFVQEPLSADLTKENPFVIDYKTTRGYDYKFFKGFIEHILNNPSKYDSHVVKLCKVAFKEEKDRSLFKTNIMDNVVYFPKWLQPRGLEIQQISYNGWSVCGEIDGKYVTYETMYDPKGISKFGPVGNIELIGKFTEVYILTMLYPAWQQYTKTNFDIIAFGVIDMINSYLEFVRGEEFRRNWTPERKLKPASEFLVDMQDVIKEGKHHNKVGITKSNIYKTIDMLKKLYPKDFYNYMQRIGNHDTERFAEWFENRYKQGKKLFTNVPNDKEGVRA